METKEIIIGVVMVILYAYMGYKIYKRWEE